MTTKCQELKRRNQSGETRLADAEATSDALIKMHTRGQDTDKSYKSPQVLTNLYIRGS